MTPRNWGLGLGHREPKPSFVELAQGMSLLLDILENALEGSDRDQSEALAEFAVEITSSFVLLTEKLHPDLAKKAQVETVGNIDFDA